MALPVFIHVRMLNALHTQTVWFWFASSSRLSAPRDPARVHQTSCCPCPSDRLSQQLLTIIATDQAHGSMKLSSMSVYTDVYG